ncbi:MAG: radical SAM protein [Deltaproteobacteria bacterium]|nr:MAG: radical SAM protein [Deltaproteobacteria bacterium]
MVCDAKELIEDGKVYLWKRCLEHGQERVLISDDVDYFKLCREVFLKPPEQVERYNTQVEHGCPYDCGICPDHEQHGCVSLLEVTDHCNLRCPLCFASSGPERHSVRSMDQIRAMLDRIVLNEGEPDVVQISGGEPTTHPQFFEILDECRRRPIKHLMVNTNGLRIAREDGFAERLAAYQPGFEIYLQFDGLSEGVSQALRGADLTATKLRAIERLNEVGLSTTLVATLKRGVNEGQIGEIIEFAAQQRAVRGVTLQPIHDSGRNEGADPDRDRLTLSEVRRRVFEQFPTLTPADIVPVPCHSDCLAMAYAIRGEGADFTELTPLTRHVPPEVLLDAGKNTIIYEGDKPLLGEMAKLVFNTFSTAHGPEGATHALRDLLCCLPSVDALPNLGYDRVFRVVIMAFLDRHTLDLRSVRKSCVHVASPDGKAMIPLDTYNIFYRGEEERRALERVRRGVGAGRALPVLSP